MKCAFNTSRADIVLGRGINGLVLLAGRYWRAAMGRSVYRKSLPTLDSAINEAIELVPDAKAGLTEVDSANSALVRLEGQAFDWYVKND